MSAVLNPMDMSGQTVLVTGASSGIGRDTAVLLSELGARVILAGRNEERLAETRDLMAEGGHHISAIDLRKHDEIESWMKNISDETGSINGLVHSAGISETCALRYIELEAVENLLSINLTAALILAKAFRRKGVRARGSASMVFVSSIAGLVSTAGLSHYSASKAGLLGLGRALAVELARENIRVNCVVPGWVKTEMTIASKEVFTEEQLESQEEKHLLGYGRPRDVSNSIAFLLAETGRWITGTSLVVDGGFIAV